MKANKEKQLQLAQAKKQKDNKSSSSAPTEGSKKEEQPKEEPKKVEEEPKEEKAVKPSGEKKIMKKAKVASKKSNKFQWQILQDSGVPDDILPNFADPKYWLGYFPPIAQEHLKKFGLMTDFRRSFITTAVNPYYDAFIRWQFNTLKLKDKLFFHKRSELFSFCSSFF
jgi:leucyl-tRNA synthetase